MMMQRTTHSDRRLRIGVLLLAVLFAGCDLFRDPAEGFDGEWKPDHGEEGDLSDSRDGPDPTGSTSEGLDATEELDGDRVVSARRPADILADTGLLDARDGSWQKEGVGESSVRLYGPVDEPDLIVEQIDEMTRTYYFNDGALFYYTEESDDGSASLTVEFDDLGDVRGSQRIVDGKRVRIDFDDFSAIVEHAIELRIQNGEGG